MVDGGVMSNHLKLNKYWFNPDDSILWRFMMCRYLSDGLVCGWVDGWGDYFKSLKSNKSWLNPDNSILFEDLWSVETSPPLGRWVG